jgi:hypothetical protein
VVVQVEFYFSDSNLPGDPFLLRSIEESGDDCIPFTKKIYSLVHGLVGGWSFEVMRY